MIGTVPARCYLPAQAVASTTKYLLSVVYRRYGLSGISRIRAIFRLEKLGKPLDIIQTLVPLECASCRTLITTCRHR